MMTRKHYQMIADAIRDVAGSHMGHAEANGALDVATALCEPLRRDNPNFNKARFLVACGFDKNSRAVQEA